MNNTIKIQTINSFFRLFNANVKIIRIIGENIFFGVLNWNDEEDTQEFKWHNIFNEEALKALSDICMFIKNNELNDNDKILISETNLQKRLLKQKWSLNKIDLAIECLMNINISMVDEGEETDSFFMHF